MKKTVIIILALTLTFTFFSVTPVRADRFWPGVAVGVGSAILLGHILHPPRAYYHDHHPVRVYNPPDYYCPPPPPQREGWIEGHWVEQYGPYGNIERFWVPGHWARR